MHHNDAETSLPQGRFLRWDRLYGCRHSRSRCDQVKANTELLSCIVPIRRDPPPRDLAAAPFVS